VIYSCKEVVKDINNTKNTLVATIYIQDNVINVIDNPLINFLLYFVFGFVNVLRKSIPCIKLKIDNTIPNTKYRIYAYIVLYGLDDEP